jgi:LysM repeat protein
MKTTLRHLLWIGALLACSDVMGQPASYTVKPGDNLAKIARRHGCSAQELAKANDLKLSSVIRPGQALKLPAKGETPDATAVAVPSDKSHTIQSGETLSAVSRKYKIPVDSLMAANPGINPKTLKVGQKISLAGASEPAAVASTTPPPSAPADKPNDETAAAAPNPTTAQPPAEQTVSAEPEGKIRTVMVENELTFGEFATQHGTEIQRLNELNGLDLTAATVLAKGSELYVPAQTRPEL